MMQLLHSDKIFFAILLVNLYDHAVGKLGYESSSNEEAKTHCNCTLAADKITDHFDSSDIAVYFTVNIESPENSTDSSENRRFVLVRNLRANFLLALPDDIEILSLTTLEHSVHTSSITMRPVNNSDCFKRLDPMCQDMVIVAAFYNTHDIHIKQGQPVCFPPLDKDKNKTENSNVVHRCCSWHKNSSLGFVNCSTVIYPNVWVSYAITAVTVGSIILFIMAPLLFKYLPTRDAQIVRRSRASGPKYLGYSNYLAVPVDSVSTNRRLLTIIEPLSFVTCGGDEAQACYSRLGRIIGVIIFPLIFCVFVLVFFITNKDTTIRTNVTYYTGLVGFLKQSVEYYVFAIVLFCILLLGALVLIPGRLSSLGKALSGRKDERTFLGFQKPDQLINHRSGKAGFQFMQSNMVFHLKCCFDFSFWLFLFKIIFEPCSWLLLSCCCPNSSTNTQENEDDEKEYEPSRCFLILGFILLPFIMALWVPFVFFCVVVYVTPIGYVAFRIFRLLYSQDLPLKCDCCERLPFCIRLLLISFLYCVFLLFCTAVLGSYIFLTVMFGVFFYMLGMVFLYTLIGLGFNVEFFIPYTVAAFFVIFYIWRAFYHYFSVYENLRIVLFEECEKYEQLESMNDHQTAGPGLLLLDNNNTPSIPLNLYVAVYCRLRPRGKTFFTIVIKLLLTLVYLSIAFAAIMSLDDAEDTSTYVQAVFLCATFALPLMLFHGSSSHGKQRRKNLEYQVRFIIHKYVTKLGQTNEASVDNPTTSEIPGNVEFVQPNDDMFEI